MKISALVPTLMLGAILALPASVRAYDGNEVWAKTCKVTEVATYPNRVHVLCVGPYTNDIVYFASPTTNSAEAARLVTLGTSALTSAGNLYVVYDLWNTDAASYGCAAHNCRRPIEMRLTK